MDQNAIDVLMMQEAVREAALSVDEDGRIHPRVGVVVARGSEILAKAHRGENGRGSHAEYTVLEERLKGADLSQCTMYTTLEPCAKREKSEKVPCARRVADRGLARVVIGMLDPDPRVHGTGVFILRYYRVSVQLFDDRCMRQVEEQNAAFIESLRHGMGVHQDMGLGAILGGDVDAVAPAHGRPVTFAVAVVERDGKYLVIRRRRKEGRLEWAFPAGMVKTGESPSQAATRETEEETGVACEAHVWFGERVHPETRRLLSYWLCSYRSGEAHARDQGEIEEVGWVRGDEAIGLFTTDVFGPISEYLRLRDEGVFD